ncbi:SAM-dependent methyltransferase [Saccharopolyspora sp. 5N708]|uniref:SAM-dependent methyltransferase n=1 Tax=Saccharopolyspora sp. 5N708 TaxID=3457424 RepID=UPI003FD0C59B
MTLPSNKGQAAPPPIDLTRASIARVYDKFLGGKDNYEVDREVYEAIMAIAPEGEKVATAIRGWLIRVINYLVGNAGIDQLLDVGSGLPTAENTHQTAQHRNPGATVVYVDNDPIVAVHGRALLEENDHTHFVTADLTRPADLLASPGVTDHLDFHRPFALIQCATLHHVDDDADPAAVMRHYIDALPAGSYVALTHWWDPADEHPAGHDLARELELRWRESSMGTGRYRTRAEISQFFDGLELLEPGLVELHDWWPNGPQMRETSLIERLILGGVGRKP